MSETQYKHCPVCGDQITREDLNERIETPNWFIGVTEDNWETCFFCGSPLIDGKVEIINGYIQYESESARKLRSKICKEAGERYRESLKPIYAKSYAERDIYECPNCGEFAGTKIKTSSRIVGLATLGVLSSNVGKTYKCKHCGYKW